jgi:aryl-alcohol dehydrogenase-like predicted oxidoreductase
MERRRLGKTDMVVSVLGFGGSEIGYERAGARTVARLLGGALDAGLNVIDTAECYDDSEGFTRHIGYSGDGEAARYAIECGRFDTLQTSVSIADQECFELTLPLAAQRGMGVIAKRPIANAVWRYARRPAEPYYQAYWKRLRALDYPFLRDAERVVSTALRFTLAAPGVHTAIVGTKRPERWPANARLLEAGPLPAAETERIRARWRQVAEPSWTGEV